MTPSRDDAWALLTEWTQSESLRKHALAVEAAVRGYARSYGENEDDWGLVALLHDWAGAAEVRTGIVDASSPAFD